MERRNLLQLTGFYENELTNQILSFWLPRCLDQVNGGYFNCFDNKGENLLSHDKYTWSQGRFAWLFAKLASTESPIFSAAQRDLFIELSRSGCDFLMKNCLIDDNDWRCVFVMDETGSPKEVSGCDTLDASIYADCFVVSAMAQFSNVSGDGQKYRFGRNLYESCLERVRSGRFETFPYPLSPQYRAHGIPMILSNTTAELLKAAQQFEPDYCPVLRANLQSFVTDILDNFTDEENVIHEVIARENTWIPGLLGQHANPGHTLEDMWFMLEASDILAKPEWMNKIAAIAKKALQIGWDEEFGGMLHFSSVNGGWPTGLSAGSENEPMLLQTRAGWSDKLWWVHSEALYTALLCYDRTGDEEFLIWHNIIFEYVFSVFPNPDPEIREWIQILKRDGTPQDKVVALPVKDPFHIIRNLILLIELLYSHTARKET